MRFQVLLTLSTSYYSVVSDTQAPSEPHEEAGRTVALPCLHDPKRPRVLAFQMAMSCLPSLCRGHSDSRVFPALRITKLLGSPGLGRENQGNT